MTDNNSMKDFMDQIDNSMKRIVKGQMVEGEVVSVTEEDVLVSIGHMKDGIIPKEKATFDMSKSLKEQFNLGDIIKAYVEVEDDGEGKILLSKVKLDRESSWDELQRLHNTQEIFEVTVKEAVKGGATTELYGVRAFIPASQLSMSYVEDISAFVNKVLKVKLIELNKDNRRVILSAKEVERDELSKKMDNLWESIDDKYRVGDIVETKVVKLLKFGAIVKLEEGVEGLVHNSQISDDRVMNPGDYLKEGQDIKVKILTIDKVQKKISLSYKEAVAKEQSTEFRKYAKNEDFGTTLGDMFGDKFKDIFK
ncbi:S1 RNA-binding domain-containing protein [Clostridium cellulovorans]|uniref:RNA binding S1 domain protein n=1 Tax=Clostridium cellulovorans (strain ATCC 35296 / DSM 3052 / OCM 3 / 743B) TaxID=573061 RepID=D9SWS6_CLOC7|nr:S1 RNA-binding domain-containing protein [Clostridium cellulovorans]ADL51287.1 RNA binding S1 domain protein [Clostridium cellulovorans 743B]